MENIPRPAPRAAELDRENRTAKLAMALEGYASLDAEEAAVLADMFIETTRKAIERRLTHRLCH